MSRHLLPCSLLALSLLSVRFAHSQQAAGEPTQPQGPVTTLKASSRLVVVDVVVTDYKGNPIHNLKQSDFTLLEKGQAQAISHFEEHTSLANAPQKIASVPKLEPGTFTNFSPAPVDGALNILLLDSLNTPMQNQTVVRDEILKYLKTARPGSRMAIFGLNQRLHLLQGFTTDPELLRQVVEGKKNLPKASALMDHPVSGDYIGQDNLTDTMTDMLGNSPSAATVAANMQQFEAQQAAFQTMLRTEYTLDALNQLGRYLSGLPGRKNLIWFSGSFPIDILPNGDLSDPFAIAATFADEFRATTNLLARSQVAVYPIDARGLFSNPVYSASNAGSKYARTPQSFGTDQAAFFNKTANEHSTMMEMASDTGGKAFVNTNGLKEAVDKAVNAGANYYTLTYQPTNKNWNGDYRKIEVKLGAPGYTLAYRQGYYADDPDAPPTKKDNANTPATATTTFNPMAVAMIWGGPDPTEIIFTATILPATGEAEPTVPDTVRLEPKVGGPYKRYIVAFSAAGKDISATPTGDGGHHINVEFVTFAYNADGALIATTGKQIGADINDAHYKAMLKSGVQFRQEISVPVKGEYFLRIGIHDLATDKVGALEVPVDSVSRLKPVAAPVAAPAPAAAPAKP